MRDFFKKIIVGIVFCIIPQCFAGDYSVLVIPDNIVTENVAVDSYIYNATSEFFADKVINILNSTDNIYSLTVSEVRNALKSNPSDLIAARNLTTKFRTSYNVDYVLLKKIATKMNARYVLLLTSYIDAENYITRRTLWDFLNIPGATVIDPAYKISTYGVLVDAENNMRLWDNSYYKTISTCENRIITRGPSPQTEQLQKIKDYSQYLGPQIAKSVQMHVLPPEVLADETTKVDYGIGDIDNVFPKKYRHLGKESNKLYQQGKNNVVEFSKDTKAKIDDTTQKIKKSRVENKLRKLEKQKELEQKDGNSSVKSNKEIHDVNFNSGIAPKNDVIKTAVYEKNVDQLEYSKLIEIEINKKKRSDFWGSFNLNKPNLRDYN